MPSFDLRIYALHGVFWLAFAAGDIAARFRSRQSPSALPRDAVAAPHAGEAPLRASNSALLVGVHTVAFALMYTGVGHAVFGAQMPDVPPVLRGVGALVIIAGGVLVGWARMAFASWRLRAQIDAGHRLATGGPFRWIRHPIYAGIDLLAVGTALWIPLPLTWIGALVMAVGGELRARAEEPLLERAFGDVYREYRRRTSRFIPGIY